MDRLWCGLAAQGLPMIGHFEGTPSEAALQNVSLSHTVAKMTLRIASGLPAGQSFTLTSVTVNNVPQVLKMVPHNPIVPTSIWEVYPGPLAPMNATYADLPLSDKTVGSATTTLGTVYMPENCMGGGTATDQRNKTAATAWNGWATSSGNW